MNTKTKQRAVRPRSPLAVCLGCCSFCVCFWGVLCLCREGGAIGFKAYAAGAKKGVRRRPRLVGRRAHAASASAACGCDGC